ncbi:U3 small nucleolar RNA-associated protein 14 homolog A-like [Dreissena polymorpha]|uniref:U3 small nucleolar RNA-associated protein 14 homolog A n=1 Tax=Dreissena polymorpha TaxID=45954 RepID=A0A9D4HPF4_DREPO|nr:U3 small nucleolar RNA-associated protein 14 homolog A-like [Dreissena polymorpha]XP_052242809.1 U3 small nucleolar RNA-associated protein 14 homolog A-like [Dreissena polymorpha]XP_052242810.1 U3 small nucleolar RNA-associated protein 14 homolog A-like [Dreissena polymorpha]KAH3726085.1 hypothetical protein DPMN_051941 [Dreissena polymorpha]
MALESDQWESLAAESDEEDLADDRKHNQLLDAISALDGKKKNSLSQRTVINSGKISEFQFSSVADAVTKVKLHELVGSLKETTEHGTLKQQLSVIQKHKQTVSTPLPKHEKAKISRTTAYEATTHDLSKWEPTVKENRKAEQLQFPLHKQDFSVVTTDQLVQRFQPRTPLEMAVAALLHGSENVVQDNSKELTLAEQRALAAMDIQKAKERRMELMKHRALLSYKELKAKRQKKIKSKRFHRILKKEKLKDEKRLLETLQKEDPESFLEKITQWEKDRVQERMSLRHRGGTKFAKRQMIYAKFDEKARQEVQDMLQKSREITQKLAATESSDEESDSGDLEPQQAGGSAFVDSRNPWMSRPNVLIKLKQGIGHLEENNAENVGHSLIVDDVMDNKNDDKGMSIIGGNTSTDLQHQKNDDSDDDSDNAIDGIFDKLKESKEPETEVKTNRKQIRLKQVRKRKKSHKSDEKLAAEAVVKTSESGKSEEGMVDSDDSLCEEPSKKRSLEDMDALINEALGQSTNEPAPKKKQRKRHKTKHFQSGNHQQSKPKADTNIDPKKLFTVDVNLRQSSSKPDVVVNEEDDDQLVNIAEAFASDDVIEEFAAEKSDAVRSGQPQDICLALPGWGDWGGAGLSISKRKKKRFTIKAPVVQRKDQFLGHVIINEKKNDALKKHQVETIPFPYCNTDQFEKSIRAPIGRTWNPAGVFKQLVKPKVVTHLGKIITPMDQSAISKHETGDAEGKTESEETESKQSNRKTGKSRMKTNKKHKGQGKYSKK